MIKHLSITQKGKLLAHQAATTANCPRAAQSCSHSLRGTLKRDITGQLVAATGGPTDTQCLLVEAQLLVIIFKTQYNLFPISNTDKQFL